MTCKPFKDQLEAYSLGLLNDQEKLAVLNHIQSCATCEQQLARLNKANQLMAKAFDQEPPEYLRTKVMANLKDVQPKKSTWMLWAAPGALSVMVLFLVIKMQPGQMMKEQALDVVKQSGISQPVAKDVELGSSGELSQEQGTTKIDNLDSEQSVELKEVSAKRKVSKSKQRSKAIKPQQVLKQEKPIDQPKIGSAKMAPKRKQPGQLDRPEKVGLDKAFKGAGLTSIADAINQPVESQSFAPAMPLQEESEQDPMESMSSPSGGAEVSDDASYKSIALKSSRKKSAPSQARRGSALAPAVARRIIPREVKKIDTPEIMVRLIKMDGGLDRVTVNQQLNKLEHSLKPIFKKYKHRGLNKISVTVDEIGKVSAIDFINDKLLNNALKRNIISTINRLEFGSPKNQKPAQITFFIKVN